MYELIQLTERDYCIECPAKIGIVDIGDGEVVMIDSGSDKDAGRRVYRILKEKEWKLKAILNTHSHADHIGGNRFLQDRCGCKIYGRGIERIVANNPILEPISLYGGLPLKELKQKFLMAKESVVEELTREVLPEGIEILELPGHSFDMIGFKTQDETAYIADCLTSEETLEKYGFPYLWNPKVAVNTLEMVKSLEARCFVPSHAPVSADVKELVRININAIEAVRRQILEIVKVPRSFEEILQKLFYYYGINMTAQQYALLGSTLRSFLTNLLEDEAIEYNFLDNRMVWRKRSI